MAKCANCGKGNIVGRSVTFSGKHNRRVFRVNLHTQWVPKGNILVKKQFCTKCLRLVKAANVPKQEVRTADANLAVAQ